MAGNQGLDAGTVAKQKEVRLGMTLHRAGDAGHDHGGAQIATHRVKRYDQSAGHVARRLPQTRSAHKLAGSHR